jgi:hypothetical protein
MADLLAPRRLEQAARIDLARRYAATLAGEWKLISAVVTGSTTRGDFNRWSDIDLLIVASELPDPKLRDRHLAATRPAGLEAIAYTSEELRLAHAKANRMVLEAIEMGVAVFGGEHWSTLISALEAVAVDSVLDRSAGSRSH